MIAQFERRQHTKLAPWQAETYTRITGNAVSVSHILPRRSDVHGLFDEREANQIHPIQYIRKQRRK